MATPRIRPESVPVPAEQLAGLAQLYAEIQRLLAITAPGSPAYRRCPEAAAAINRYAKSAAKKTAELLAEITEEAPANGPPV